MTRSFTTFDDYRRHLRNKYGQGVGKDYKPWFTVRDVKDKNAFRTEVSGLKTGRFHQLLSSIERDLFYILEYRDDVIDIREQFPLLPLELSQKIANTIQVAHPKVKKTGTPFIMTTDVLATVIKNNTYSYIAFCVKPQSKLRDRRVLEKIEIERVWWESLGVPFTIFTGNNNTEILSRNISWVTAPVRLNIHHELEALLGPAISLLYTGKHIKADICDLFMTHFNLDHMKALNLLMMLIAKKLINVDLSILLEESKHITIKDIDTSGKMANGTY